MRRSIEAKTKDKNKVQIEVDELDILHRLYKMEKEYVKSFEILVKMKSQKCFEFFAVNYNGFNQEKILEVYLIKLLRIDSKKTVQILLKNKHGEA